MSTLFDEKLIKSLQCSDEQVEVAKKFGVKHTYEEHDKECVYYLYNGKCYLVKAGDKSD